MAYKKKTKKIKRNVPSAVAHVRSTFNNTIITIATRTGDALTYASAGKLGFKGARKGTPFAATQVASTLVKDMQIMGVKELEVNLQGPGSGRDAAVRLFQSSGFQVTKLRDVTPLPHNGCRAPKKRRV